MNTRMDDLARQHVSEMRHQAASRSAAGREETSPGHTAARTPRLRRRVGFALVEAGFHLLGTDHLPVRN
jgi:hypothetical protein